MWSARGACRSLLVITVKDNSDISSRLLLASSISFLSPTLSVPPDSHYQVELTNPEKAAVNKTYGADSQPNIFKSNSFWGKINCSYPYYGNNVRRKGRREERNEKMEGTLNLNLNTK